MRFVTLVYIACVPLITTLEVGPFYVEHNSVVIGGGHHVMLVLLPLLWWLLT